MLHRPPAPQAWQPDWQHRKKLPWGLPSPARLVAFPEPLRSEA